MIGESKRAVTNKSKVEGSISAFCLQRETTYFCSHYFKNFCLLPNTSFRNDPRSIHDNVETTLSVISKPGRPSGKASEHWLTDDEWKSTHVHILINCNEVKPYLE